MGVGFLGFGFGPSLKSTSRSLKPIKVDLTSRSAAAADPHFDPQVGGRGPFDKLLGRLRAYRA